MDLVWAQHIFLRISVLIKKTDDIDKKMFLIYTLEYTVIRNVYSIQSPAPKTLFHHHTNRSLALVRRLPHFFAFFFWGSSSSLSPAPSWALVLRFFPSAPATTSNSFGECVFILESRDFPFLSYLTIARE